MEQYPQGPTGPGSPLLSSKDRVREHFRRVVRERKVHWSIVTAIILGFFLVGHYLEDSSSFLDLRYTIYRRLQNPWPRPTMFRDTVVVRIDDDAYWVDAHHRQPTDRVFLAKLLERVVEANPAVVVLDIVLASPDRTGRITSTAGKGTILLEDKVYALETETLLKAINDAAKKCPIVLIESLDFAPGNTGPSHHHSDRRVYIRAADVYDRYPLQNVRFGYHILEKDRRVFPTQLRVNDGTYVDSLALAAARAYRPERVERRDWTEPRYVSFVEPEETLIVQATDLLHGDEARTAKLQQHLSHRIVVIGSDWHTDPSREHAKVDQHSTPVGAMAGVMLHANYIEALLDDRVYDVPTAKWFVFLADVAFGYLLAYVLVFPTPPPRQGWKLLTKATVAVVVILTPIGISFILLERWGIYWDTVILSMLLVGHFVFERLVAFEHH